MVDSNHFNEISCFEKWRLRAGSNGLTGCMRSAGGRFPPLLHFNPSVLFIGQCTNLKPKKPSNTPYSFCRSIGFSKKYTDSNFLEKKLRGPLDPVLTSLFARHPLNILYRPDYFLATIVRAAGEDNLSV